jgi:monoamine oxidase
MAGALRRAVQFTRVVTAIETLPDRAIVRCQDGARFAAREVVCALPVGALRRLAIAPPLQGAQAEAVRDLRMQPLTQVYLASTQRFWEQDGYAPSLFTDSTAGMLAAVRNGDDPREITGFTAWVMGREAARLDTMSAAEAGRAVIEAIERVRPSAKGHLELLGLQSWGRDPYASGAWAYFGPGEVRRFAPALGASHGRLHFCGEHLATVDRGMEGAMESGHRAALQVLARL